MAYNEKKKATNAKWDAANIDRMSIAFPKGERERIKADAAAAGMSANQYIYAAVKAYRDSNATQGETE